MNDGTGYEVKAGGEGGKGRVRISFATSTQEPKWDTQEMKY